MAKIKSMTGRSFNLGASFLAAATASALTGLAHAQSPEENARQGMERQFEEARDTGGRRDGGGAIPFAAIQNAPEDVSLAVAYARQEIAAGDFKEAGATLERLLLTRPTLYDVRVLYGLVLYRLGLYERAKFELELALESGRLPPGLAAEAETYLGRIRYELRPTRASLTLTTGADWDSNRNQAPTSGSVLSFDTPVPANARNGDGAFLFSAVGRLTHDLGVQEGHQLFVDAAYYRSDKAEVDNLDLDAVLLAVGGTFNAGAWSVTPKLRGGKVWLAGDDYLRTFGGELEVAYRWSPVTTTYASVRAEDEDFRATVAAPMALTRTGLRVTSRVGTAWRMSTTTRLAVEGLYMIKNGAASYETYDRYGANARFSWLLGRGAFAVADAAAEKSDYEGADVFVSATTREEWLYRARVSVGAPVSLFLPGAPEAVKDINIIAQYEYERADSNLLNYDYRSHRTALLLSKRLAF